MPLSAARYHWTLDINIYSILYTYAIYIVRYTDLFRLGVMS